MGDAKRRQLALQNDALEALKVDPPGGRIHMQCDHQARATPDAQLTPSLPNTGAHQGQQNKAGASPKTH